jgi:cytoskeletal protein RodZ
MNETPHPAVVARRRRLHQIRVRVATAAVGLFIAIFSVIYSQMPATARVTTAQKHVATTSSSSSSSSTSAGSSSATSSSNPTPMTTSQS